MNVKLYTFPLLKNYLLIVTEIIHKFKIKLKFFSYLIHTTNIHIIPVLLPLNQEDIKLMGM